MRSISTEQKRPFSYGLNDIGLGISLDDLMRKQVFLSVDGEMSATGDAEVFKLKKNKSLVMLESGKQAVITREKETIYIGVTPIGEFLYSASPLNQSKFKKINETCPAQDKNGDEFKSLEWLENGRVGLSSRAMCFHLGSARVKEIIRETFGDDNKNHPHDPSDFKRCLAYLEAVPNSKNKIGLMSSVSKEWAVLAKAWPDLLKLYEEEKSLDSAPKLYAEMHRVLLSANSSKKQSSPSSRA